MGRCAVGRRGVALGQRTEQSAAQPIGPLTGQSVATNRTTHNGSGGQAHRNKWMKNKEVHQMGDLQIRALNGAPAARPESRRKILSAFQFEASSTFNTQFFRMEIEWQTDLTSVHLHSEFADPSSISSCAACSRVRMVAKFDINDWGRLQNRCSAPTPRRRSSE